uniref:DUF4261 domain-containing protein n=1 Tax=Ascaris lumbricoides TaxID=6252 RepID=A0A0M3IWA0_ASCLU
MIYVLINNKASPDLHLLVSGEMFVSPNLEMQHIDDTSFTFGWVLKALNEMDHDWINISSGRKVKNVCA